MTKINYSLKAIFFSIILLLNASVFPQDSQKMTFKVVGNCSSISQQIKNCLRVPIELGDGQIVLAEGRIAKDSENDFSEAVKSLPPATIVIFNSRGGDVIGSLRLGQSIRARDFYTYIQSPKINSNFINDKNLIGKCIGSCTYAFK